ncbi:MAG: hydroxyacylglutathione hydrolase [Porticoccaceae bacterium]|jgi:hydroxyacylglutathione hydrolase|nr:hydroxyacylglutathione hydrolase [Porticoccaceae bacterium]
MLVEQIWTDNPLRNFHYLVACPETLEALAIDPFDHQLVLQRAEALGWKITQIVNTHEHFDHIDGNQAMIAATGATLLAHANARDKIANMDTGLQAGAVVKVGSLVELEVLDTPGHTMSHVCLLSKTEVPALFSGDTLFNAGVGHCHAGGDPEVLAKTVFKQMDVLPDETLLYPGHDYIINNLGFTLDREPNNLAAQALLEQVQGQDPNDALITNLGQERQINTFFRTSSTEIIKNFSDLAASATPKEVFLALRERRNSW